MKRLDMINSKDILRQRFGLGLTRDQIATAVGVSAGSVSNVLKRAAAAGLAQWPLPDGLDDNTLHDRLYPTVVRDKEQMPPDWDEIINEFKSPRGRRRAKLTKRQLWIDYRDEVEAQGGSAYCYSQFCALLKEQLNDGPDAAVMRFEYAPGHFAMSDFSGKTLSLRTAQGDVDVEIFVAVLPHSNLIYAEAVPDQKVSHWCMTHRRALEYFGGVPKCVIIDNLKSGVKKSDREAPHLNPTFREFALHYGIAVLPTRANRPQDKGPVESAVGTVQSRILLALRKETFFSLSQMNAAIRRELHKLNTTPMANGESRRALFEASEQGMLAALPLHSWEWGEWHIRKAARNCHVAIERNHYSVPAAYIGRDVHVRLSERMVEVFLQRDGERIAVHPRNKGKNQYATQAEHMPKRLNAVRDIRNPDYGDFLLRQAHSIGPNASVWAERCFASRDFPEQAYTTVQGMIRLAERYGNNRLDALCAEAIDIERFASGYLRDRLKSGGKPKPMRPGHEETIPDHGNIRGSTYYRRRKAP